MTNNFKKIFFFILLTIPQLSHTQSNEIDDLVLDDPEDMKLLLEDFPADNLDQARPSEGEQTELSATVDDLNLLEEDLKDIEFGLPEEDDVLTKKIDKVDDVRKKESEAKLDNPVTATQKVDTTKKPKIIEDNVSKEDRELFDVGRTEKDLLEVAKTMQGQIENKAWNEIAAQTSQSSYTVVKGDWLWKISQRLFGSGFYYAKIWSINSYITNPHEIEPGMVLVFTTGTDLDLPKVSINQSKKSLTEGLAQNNTQDDFFNQFGADSKPDWLSEREQLKKNGAFVQYSTADTLADLNAKSDQALITEYEAYDPPVPEFNTEIPSSDYDERGFDKNKRVRKAFKEGFYLNTFISTNIVQDFGKVSDAIEEKGSFTKFDRVFLKFDEKIDLVTGDKFSIYSAKGKMTHPNSDRDGYQYTIVGSVELVQKHQNKWECKIIETSGIIQREDRVTVYTPKIERITKTFNSRLIESIVIGHFNPGQSYASFGDVVYLDRGRADGVEMGNIFEVYGFKDRGTNKDITPNPTYKNGELNVVSVTDNFSTAIVSLSKRDFKVGDIAITKTKKSATKDYLITKRLESKGSTLDKKALDKLDIELNLDDLNDDLLDKADKIKFTEDELAELERQEREKSIISEEEKDLKALERLEGEITTAEAMLNESRLDEDKLLENENLNSIEDKLSRSYEESLEEIEENFGKLYLDEDINDKNNPYGLTEFDIEEIDELLNVEGELDAPTEKQ